MHTQGRGPAANVRSAFRLATAMMRDRRNLRRMYRLMPKPVPWDWAAPRLVPLLAGPYIDADGPEPVRVVSEPGCAIVFGLEFAGVFPLVDVDVAERWETSPDQLRDAAMENLRRRAGKLTRDCVKGGTLSGRIVRSITGIGWASSLVLLPDELVRLLGDDDQVLGVPGRDRLISFGIDTPTSIVANIVVDYEMDEISPLFLDPFVLMDGRILWAGNVDQRELDDDDDDDDPWEPVA